MSLFGSKFAKLEALAAAKENERTPAMLAAAQEELDRATAGVILVPKTEKVKTVADLEKINEDLTTEASKAKEEATKATDALTALKSERIDKGEASSDKGGAGDEMTPEAKAEAERQAAVHNSGSRWNLKADEMGLNVGAATAK